MTVTGPAEGVPLVAVMGVSGAGKSTVGVALAARLGVPFLDGDDLHPPANVAKMAAGTPLDDDDRAPWLAAVGAWLAGQPSGGVVACSALRRRYRDAIRSVAPATVFVHLSPEPEVLTERLARRRGHYMPAGLLGSQLATLEPLEPDEPGFTVEALGGAERVADIAAARLRAIPPLTPGRPTPGA